jgi:hypothetical protein
MSGLLRHPLSWVILTVGAVGLVVGLALFQPWKLWVDQTVIEGLPASTAAPTDTPQPGQPGPTDQTGETDRPAQAGPRDLYRGTFISHEHRTTGSVRITELPDGSRVLRLENLDTSNGPDLKVWITDAPVIEGRKGWHVFDDGRYVNLGRLKGNKGSQNYPIPADVDLSRYPSVSIWCDRFNVSFGAAELESAGTT